MPHLKKIKIIITVLFLLSIVRITFYFLNKEPEQPKQPEQSIVTPVVQTEVKQPSITVQEKKAQFKTRIIPAINTVYAKLMQQYKDIKEIIDAGKSNATIEKLKVEYKVATNSELLMALKPHPKSIAIAQAAMESSWATSRFFKEANNVFGVWSFNENEPRLAALQKRGDKTIWVKKYASVEAAVFDYYRTLARSSAFAEFRKAKMLTDDPFLLVKELDRYSEKGHAYGEELTAIIKFNKFDAYDKK